MQDGNSFLLQIRLNFIVDRTSGTDKKPQYLSRWKGSNQLLLVAIGFCLVLSSAAEPYLKGSAALTFLSGCILIHQFMRKWCKNWCSTPLFINKAAYG